MFYFLNENTEIDLGKISVVDKKTNILTGETGVFVRVDGREIKVTDVEAFMEKFRAFNKQEALNKQYLAS